MCDPISIGMLAAGAGLSYINTNAQNKAAEAASRERQMYYNRNLQAQRKADRQVGQAVEQTGQLYTPEATQERIQDYNQQTEDSINNQILSANLALPESGPGGRVSDNFIRLSGQVRANEDAETARLVRNYARLSAPNYAAFDQASDMTRYNDDIMQALRTGNAATGYGTNAAGLVNVQPNTMAGVMGGIGQALIGQGLGRGIGNWGGGPGAPVSTGTPLKTASWGDSIVSNALTPQPYPVRW